MNNRKKSNAPIIDDQFLQAQGHILGFYNTDGTSGSTGGLGGVQSGGNITLSGGSSSGFVDKICPTDPRYRQPSSFDQNSIGDVNNAIAYYQTRLAECGANSTIQSHINGFVAIREANQQRIPAYFSCNNLEGKSNTELNTLKSSIQTEINRINSLGGALTDYPLTSLTDCLSAIDMEFSRRASQSNQPPPTNQSPGAPTDSTDPNYNTSPPPSTSSPTPSTPSPTPTDSQRLRERNVCVGTSLVKLTEESVDSGVTWKEIKRETIEAKSVSCGYSGDGSLPSGGGFGGGGGGFVDPTVPKSGAGAGGGAKKVDKTPIAVYIVLVASVAWFLIKRGKKK